MPTMTAVPEMSDVLARPRFDRLLATLRDVNPDAPEHVTRRAARAGVHATFYPRDDHTPDLGPFAVVWRTYTDDLPWRDTRTLDDAVGRRNAQRCAILKRAQRLEAARDPHPVHPSEYDSVRLDDDGRATYVAH